MARLVSFAVLAVLVAGGLCACTSPSVHFVPGPDASTSAAPKPKTTTPAPAAKATVADATFTLSAVGDTIMASAPRFLPPRDGRDFFAPVAKALHSDLQMANLEEPLTSVAASTKCSAANLGKTCFAFRAPPSYASVLKDAGFGVVNIANNHAVDYGQNGHTQTEHALTDGGVKYTGPPGMITTTTVNGIRIAVLGFAPYPWANDLRDIEAAAALVHKATKSADLVIIQAHMGAEGAAYQHVKHGVQTFLGENRGDVIAFSHAMIDAGADIVIGHGPHVLRAMEFYRGHLIAYSLGNFAGYHALSVNSVTGVSMILRVTLRGDGSFVRATMVPTSMVVPGVPRMDPKNRAIPLVRSLTKTDFPKTGAQIAANGAITPPAV